MVRDRKAGRPLRSAPEEVNSKERFASGQRRCNCRSLRCPGSQTPPRVYLLGRRMLRTAGCVGARCPGP